MYKFVELSIIDLFGGGCVISSVAASFVECPVCLVGPEGREGNFEIRGHRSHEAIHAVCLPCIRNAGPIPMGEARDRHLLNRCIICRALPTEVVEEIFTVDSTGNVLSSIPAPQIQMTQLQIGALHFRFESRGPDLRLEGELRFGNPYEEMRQIGDFVASALTGGIQLVNQQARSIWANVFDDGHVQIADQSRAQLHHLE